MKNDTRFALAVAWSLFMAVFFTISFVARMPVMVAADGLLFGIGTHNVHHYWPTRARNQLDYNKIARLEQEVYGKTFTHDGAPPIDPCKVFGTVQVPAYGGGTRPIPSPKAMEYIHRPPDMGMYACNECKSLNMSYHEPWCAKDTSKCSFFNIHGYHHGACCVTGRSNHPNPYY